jgi:hypothetical protein
MSKIFIVHASWDPATSTWSTNGEDIPGLVCETDTLETLIEVILDATPDLLHDNLGIPSGQTVDIIVLAERQAQCTAA